MQGTGKSYEISGETTEWEDILIRKGIKTREQVFLEKGLNPDDFIEDEPEPEPELDKIIMGALKVAKADEDQLKAMEEEDDEDEDKVLAQFREKRLQELKQKAAKYRYGDVYSIGKDDWMREVTEGSKAAWVVVHLFQDSVLECRIVEEYLVKLAAKFRDVKFVKIRSTQAIENWPDKNLPAIFVYHDGVLNCQLVTLSSVGGKTTTIDDLEWWLAERRIVETELEDNPRNLSEKRSLNRITRRDARDSDDDDLDDLDD